MAIARLWTLRTDGVSGLSSEVGASSARILVGVARKGTSPSAVVAMKKFERLMTDHV